MVDWKQLVRARLEELGMAQLDVRDSLTKIEREVSEAIRSNRAVSRKNKREPATAPLSAALRRALKGSRAIRRYLGDGNQVDGLVEGVLVELESSLAIEEGERWCDECVNWHPSTPHNPAALWTGRG